MAMVKPVAPQQHSTSTRTRNPLRHNHTHTTPPPENLEGRGGRLLTPESGILFFRGAAKSALTCGDAVAERVVLQCFSGGPVARNALVRNVIRAHV